MRGLPLRRAGALRPGKEGLTGGGGMLVGAIESAAARSPDAVSFIAPGRGEISYKHLVEQIHATWRSLRALGIGRQDRLAMALPNSPELGVLMVATMSAATAVPLDANYTAVELQQHLTHRRAKAVVVPRDGGTAARTAAQQLNLPLIELIRGEVPGTFQLQGPSLGPVPAEPPGEGDEHEIAMVLQTSGTTGSPKVVPLTRRNMGWLASRSKELMQLGPRDRALCMSPMVHMTGVGALLYPLVSGGSEIVTSGFVAEQFFDWMERYTPTWYSAVPAVHQAILQHATRHESVVKKISAAGSLRFVRSIAAAMPRGVPEQIESLFNTTYLEGAGSTEASLITSMLPDRRRTGSIGLAVPGVEIRVIDGAGNSVGPGVEGEIVVRSPGVFAGYENNPEANAVAFVDGFFRTGDLGSVDADGFYYLSGRVREQINRGGSKVSPPEVDDVLRQHPAVAEAVTFAMPDDRLGEEVAASVLLHAGKKTTELELQRFAAERLADYKVPRRVVFVEQVLRGPTGKPLRVGLAEKLGVRTTLPPVLTDDAVGSRHVDEPRTPAEMTLAAIWSEAIDEPVTDIDARFTALGGDSLQAVSVTVGIEKQFGRRLPLAALFNYPTIRAMANLLETDGWRPTPGAPVVLRDGETSRPALFVLPGILGNVYNYYSLARYLPVAQRVIGLPLPGADGLEPPLTSFHEVADRYVAQMRQQQPIGPYLLCGYSIGGRIAFEVERRLTASGADVALLGMLDTPAPDWPPPLPLTRRAAMHLRRMRSAGVIKVLRSAMSRRRSEEALLADAMDHAGADAHVNAAQPWQSALLEAYRHAARTWAPVPIHLPIHLFRAAITVWTDCDVSDPAMGWSGLTAARVMVTPVPGSHGSLFHEPNVAGLAAAVGSAIDAVLASREVHAC